MKKLLMIFVCFTIIVLNISAQQESVSAKIEWTGTTMQKISGLMTIWAEVKYGFPQKKKLSALNWDKKVLEFIPRVIHTEDIEGYYQVLEEMVALLKDSHTEIIPPWGRFKPGFDNPPIEVKIIGDKFYIIRTGDSDEIRGQEISAGMEILAVGDRVPIRTYFNDNVIKYHSGNTQHGNEALYVFFLFYGPANEKVKLTVKDQDNTVKEVILTRNSANRDGSPFFYRFVQNFIKPTIESKMLSNGILYVNIPNFEKESIHIDFQKLIDRIDTSTVRGLVLDVRLNMGGSSASCNNIVKCLINSPVSSPQMTYPHYIAAEKAWGKKDKWTTIHSTIEPGKGKKYLGPIVILTDAVTISTAEDLIIELQQRGQVMTVGETTAGGAGNGLFSPLPGGGQFRVSTFHATCYPDGKEYVGIGIKPDYILQPSVKDICNGNDVVLEKGIEVIMNWDANGKPEGKE